MTSFDTIKPTLELLIKDKSDAANMTRLLARFLEQNVAKEFIEYLNQKNLMTQEVWLNLNNQYYVQMPKEHQTKAMDKFLFQHSLSFIEKYLKENDKSTVEHFLANLVGHHSLFQRDDTLLKSWLYKKEAQFFEHIFNHITFTPYEILRHALRYMVKPCGELGYSLEFNDKGLKLLNDIYQKEKLSTFLDSMDREVIFNSNFSPIILKDLIEENKLSSHYNLSWGHNGNKTGLNQMVFKYNKYPYGTGKAISEYLFINPFIDLTLFTQCVENITMNNQNRTFFVNTIVENKFLADAIYYDVNKVTYVIDKFNLDIKKTSILDYKDLVNTSENYLDNLIALKNNYTGEKTISFGFNFMMNAIIYAFSLENDDTDSRLEKLLSLTNKKQLNKKELYSNAIKYLNHQKSTNGKANELVIFMEKIYFELDNNEGIIMTNPASSRKRKI